MYCKYCKTEKSALLFRDGHLSCCRQCDSDLQKGKTKSRMNQLVYKYGVDDLQYHLMLKSQNGVCAICGEKCPRHGDILSVDHCHTTKKVRGLLCVNCNSLLGKGKDNPELLRKAAEYLEQK